MVFAPVVAVIRLKQSVPGEHSWYVPIEGDYCSFAKWTLVPVPGLPGSWTVKSLKVVSADDAVMLTFADSDSVWEPVLTLTHRDDTIDLTTDSFVGMRHNVAAQSETSAVIVANGLAVPPGVDVADICRGFVQQHATTQYPATSPSYLHAGEFAGRRGTYHVFEDARLRIQTLFDFAGNADTRTAYAAMIPLAPYLPGGLSRVTPYAVVNDEYVATQPTLALTGANGAVFWGASDHEPDRLVYSSPAHSYELVVDLAYGGPGRYANGTADWSNANEGRVLVVDNAAPDVSKTYVMIYSSAGVSGTPLLPFCTATDYRIRKV